MKHNYNPWVKDPRQTGRSNRIAMFAVDQLLSVGEVIVADHIAYQFEALNQSMATGNLIRLVKLYLRAATAHLREVNLRCTPVCCNNVWMVHFTIKPSGHVD